MALTLALRHISDHRHSRLWCLDDWLMRCVSEERRPQFIGNCVEAPLKAVVEGMQVPDQIGMLLSHLQVCRQFIEMMQRTSCPRQSTPHT